MPDRNFVHFATPACAPETITAEFVNSARAIIAHVYNRAGQRMPPFSRYYLVTKYCWRAALMVDTGPCSVAEFAYPKTRCKWGSTGVCYIPERLHDQPKSAGHEPDTVIQKFVGIAIELVEDLRQIDRTITKPKGNNNTLRRWSDVFRPRQQAGR